MECTKADLERFWSKVEKTKDCWLWRSQLRNGYGTFRLNSKIVSAHRLSYFLEFGVEPGNKIVRHTCDTPACVRPSHLLLGSNKDNSDDKMSRNRHNFPLSNEQVLDIRSRPLSITMCRDLAKEFHTTQRKIKSVLTGKSYQWLPGAREIPRQFTAHKFTPEQIADIIDRAQKGTWGIKTKLAKEYGVTPGQISHITNHRNLYNQIITDTQ